MSLRRRGSCKNFAGRFFFLYQLSSPLLFRIIPSFLSSSSLLRLLLLFFYKRSFYIPYPFIFFILYPPSSQELGSQAARLLNWFSLSLSKIYSCGVHTARGAHTVRQTKKKVPRVCVCACIPLRDQRALLHASVQGQRFNLFPRRNFLLKKKS